MVDTEQQYVCIVCFCCVYCLLHICVVWFHIKLSTDKYCICVCVCVCVCAHVLMHVTLHSNNIFSSFILQYLGYLFFLLILHTSTKTLTLLSFIAKSISATSRSLLFRILITRSCRIFSKCNKVADKKLTQLTTFEKYIYIWVFSLILEENILITYMWLNKSHYTE
jgi:hypothetical protein